VFLVERVTGIEPALSAWESDRSGPLSALTWASDAPLVTVMNPVIPGLMADQWPMAWQLWLTRLLSLLLSALEGRSAGGPLPLTS